MATTSQRLGPAPCTAWGTAELATLLLTLLCRPLAGGPQAAALRGAGERSSSPQDVEPLPLLLPKPLCCLEHTEMASGSGSPSLDPGPSHFSGHLRTQLGLAEL